MELGNVLDAVLPAQQHRFERPRQIYQVKSTVGNPEYVTQVKVAVAVAGVVKFPYK